jgi:hypothetical protein
MTRINVVPVAELSSKHLLAEYRELPRISALAHRYSGGVATPPIPATYRLGTGHVTFFYDKGEFLRRRFEEEIVPELTRRGYSLSHTTYRAHPEGMNKDWTPTPESIRINRDRIDLRTYEASQRAATRRGDTQMSEQVNPMKLTKLVDEHVCSCGAHISGIRQYNILGNSEGYLWFNCAICKSTRLVPESKVIPDVVSESKAE